jgi:hypothetical protein
MMLKAYVELAKEKYDYLFIGMLLLGELVLGTLIIFMVPYTEIDWEAYMQEVDFWLNGEYDYRKIYGGTGPLVYPAGFLYLFGFLQWVTNREIPKAQIIFLGFYVVSQAIVLALYQMVLRQIRQSPRGSTPKASLESESDAWRSHEVWLFRVSMG